MCVFVCVIQEPYADAAATTALVGNKKLMHTTHRIDFIITFFRVTIIFCVRDSAATLPVHLLLLPFHRQDAVVDGECRTERDSREMQLEIDGVREKHTRADERREVLYYIIHVHEKR